MPDREAIQFLCNTSVEVALEQTAPTENALGNWTYFLTEGRIMHVPKVCSVLIGNLDPQPGEVFYVTRRRIRQGRKSQIEWLVTAEEPITTHEPGAAGTVCDIAGAVAATGIQETQLEKQLRESLERKAIQQKAAERIRAKINLEQKGPIAVPPAPEPEPLPERKPPETASAPSPAPPAPEPPKPAERIPWSPNLVEVARSYTYKLNMGNYETRDFFCSEKAECRPEDAELVSDRLYEFCKRQVMKAVEMETVGKQRRQA